MKDKKLRNLVEEVEEWAKFNSNPSLHLLDLSKLITILRRYYHITELEGGKK